MDYETHFWSNTEPVGECWLWSLSGYDSGYGKAKFRQKTVPAHRVAWIITNG